MRWIIPICAAAIVALSVAYWLLAEAASAQQTPPCGDADRVEALLTERHGERVVGFGVVEAGVAGLMRIWATPGGETWSITVTAANERMPSGLATCIVGSGTVYRPARIEGGDQS